MSDYKDPSSVLKTIQAGDSVEWDRGTNRININKAANNEPLMSETEAKKVGMKIFNRWGEFMNALAHAARQYLTNFTSQDTFFTVSLPKAPEENRADWEGTITEAINDLMKDGEREMDYFMVHLSKWKAVVSHGIGPIMWEDSKTWLPRYVAIEDLRIATDTELSFRNLSWFAVRIAYTPGELSRKAFSKAGSKYKWDTKAVAEILKHVDLCNTTMAENNYDWDSTPEKFEELRKQNAGYWSGDAMPTINLWHFYFKNDDGKWELKVVPEKNAAGTSAVTGDKFICEHEGPVADSWREIIHVQFGDLNNKAPLMYHSVRSLGFALFEPCFWSDMTRCRMLQHVHDNFNIWLRSSDPADRARAQIQVFQNMGFVKPGITVVPNNERHQVDGNLVESALAGTKQLQQEASTMYSQSVDTGTSREQTAFETGVKVQQNNAMLSGLMMMARQFEKTACKEICRRFCLKNSDDEDVLKFQATCKADGIPEAWLDVSKWRIGITAPLGNGNPTMAMVEAENAMKLRPMLDPSAQAEALHDAAVQMVGTRRAQRWIKTKQKVISDAAATAANAFPLMMLGMPPQIPEGLNPIEQIQTLLGLAGAYIMKVEQTTQIPTQNELQGLKTVAAYLGQLIQGMAGDMGNQQKFKEFQQDLSQLNNELKKMEQQLTAEMQKQQPAQGPDQIKMIDAMTTAKIKEAANNQKLTHNEQKFQQKQQLDSAKTAADIQRDHAKAASEVFVQSVRAKNQPESATED